MQGNDGVVRDCVTRAEALQQLAGLLSHRTVLVGYNVFLVLAVLLDMADSVGREQLASQVLRGLAGLVDIKWLLPPNIKDRSLAGICKMLDIKIWKKFQRQTAELAMVDRALAAVLQQEMDLTSQADIDNLRRNFSIKISPKDLKFLSKKEIEPSKSFFLKFRNTSFEIVSNDNEEPMNIEADEDDDSGLLNNYTQHIQYESHYQALQMYEKDANTFILSVKMFELEERKFLNAVTLCSVAGQVLLNCEAVVPLALYGGLPGLKESCSSCRLPGVAALHRSRDCPASQPCTIHPPGSSQHARRDCRDQRCWNCGQEHNWSQCRQYTMSWTGSAVQWSTYLTTYLFVLKSL